jgi:hypothetical protein
MKAPYSNAVGNDVTLNIYRLRIKNLYDLVSGNPIDTLNNAPGTHPLIAVTAMVDVPVNTLVAMNKAKKTEILELINKLSNLVEEAIDANQS